MKNIYFCILIILPLITFGQSPCDDTQVSLSSQSDVDNFPSRYCGTLCSLTISGDDITNLDSLYVLQKVGSLRVVFNPLLADINGLANLASIEGSCASGGVVFEGNNMLSDLNGLSGLTRILGPLTLTSNTMLNDLTGLANLVDVDDINIRNNASLENLDGFERLTVIGGSVSISGNPGLSSLNGFSNVTSINGALVIETSDGIVNLDGLSGLTRIGRQLSISYNPDLLDIRGLSNVNHVGNFSASGNSVGISYNEELQSLEGLEGLDSIPGVLVVEGNSSLTDLDPLSSVTTLAAPFGDSYNSGIRIAGNNALIDISGIGNIETIDHGRASYLEIISNEALTTISPLKLKAIAGNLGSTLRISDNGHLVNIDGLSSLQRVDAGIAAVIEIAHNPSLQNIDGLSSLSNVRASQNPSIAIAYNPMLGRFCGLYTLIHNKGINCGSTECYNPSAIWFDGNERNPTPEQIEEEGPCDATVSQPTNIVFSQVTAEGMRVRFNNADGFVGGYLVLMQAYGASAPETVPQDGTTYHVGQVLNSSSIVVSVGKDTTFVVSGLIPSTPYHFDVFSYRTGENGIDYLTISPLQGVQSTNAQAMFASALTFADVSDESMTVMLDEPEQGNYICLMKAFGYPSPHDVPVNGKEYRVGNTIGSGTIVVNIGDGSEFTVNGLMPGLTYYFDIYKYDAGTLVYQQSPSQGSQKTNERSDKHSAYPNPFDVATTISFEVSEAQPVQVAIYDVTGREISVLTTGSFGAGQHEASWDGYDMHGRRMNAGVYIYSIKTESGAVTGRISLR